MDFAGFDWDAANRAKCLKHGVSIAEIESLFRSIIRIAPDLKHSAAEDRFKAIGMTSAGRNVLVVFTLRLSGQGKLVRPVSARYMHRKEVIYYEKETSRSEK